MSINSDVTFDENKIYTITAIMNNLHVKGLNEKIDYFITLPELRKYKLQKINSL